MGKRVTGEASELGRLLSRYGLESSESAVLAAMQAELEATGWTSTDPKIALEASRVGQYLRQHAGLSDAEADPEWSAERENELRLRTAAARAIRLVAMSLSEEQAARILALPPQQVAVLAEQERLCVIGPGSRRYPAWQFAGGSLVPGVEEIARTAIEFDLPPDSVERFMLIDNDELDGRTPLTHLMTGGAVEAVTALLQGWART